VAFLIVNVFQAVQYFALVWSTEKRNRANLTHAGASAMRRVMVFAGFLAVRFIIVLMLVVNLNKITFPP
jgi:hypothetical protein